MGQAAALFDNIPDQDICGLYDAHGGINYRKVVDVMHFKNEDVSLATGLPKTSVRYDVKMPQELKDRLIEWATAINLVAGHFNDLNKTMMWFQAPNPMLGSIAPRDMIRLGRFKKLMKYIQSALDANNQE